MTQFKIGDTVRRINCNFGSEDRKTLVVVGKIYTVDHACSVTGIQLEGLTGTYKAKNFELVSEAKRVITEEVCTRLVGLRDAHSVKEQELQDLRDDFEQAQRELLGEVTEILDMIVELKAEYGIA